MHRMGVRICVRAPICIFVRAMRQNIRRGIVQLKQMFLLAALCVVGFQVAGAQSTELPKQEFRGAWIATVLNLDWPGQGVHSSFQKSSLITMLDDLKDAGTNAVFFQIRSEADAMYDSAYEPWSFWLSGEQGTPASPYFDPLAFAIEETHKRGMELHAWMNPYRAIRNTNGYTQAADHVTNLHPEWSFTTGTIVTLDPGQQAVRSYITNVIMDVARNYDIDGIHFDDFFYPYPPDQISNQDSSTYADESRGFTDLGDWRRDNVNLFVQQVSDSLNAFNPSLKFGISPFGIWKNGVPSGIVGLDAYNVIYSDPIAWLTDESIDYLVPQLYWAFGGGQDYAKLAPWWADQMNGRHLYTGHGLYRSDANTFSGTLFSSTEIPSQVRFNRAQGDIQGSVFFRARNITIYPSKGFADSLKFDLFRKPALTPTMSWKDLTVPDTPEDIAYQWISNEELELTWSGPSDQGTGAEAKRFAVYRVQSPELPDFSAAILNAENLLTVTGDTVITDKPVLATDPYYYFVTSVSSNSVESTESGYVLVEGRAVSVDPVYADRIATVESYPNPFDRRTNIVVTLEQADDVEVRVYNSIGQMVTVLAERQFMSGGEHRFTWEGTDNAGRHLGSGTYFIVVASNSGRISKGVTLIR